MLNRGKANKETEAAKDAMVKAFRDWYKAKFDVSCPSDQAVIVTRKNSVGMIGVELMAYLPAMAYLPDDEGTK